MCAIITPSGMRTFASRWRDATSCSAKKADNSAEADFLKDVHKSVIEPLIKELPQYQARTGARCLRPLARLC